MRYLFLVFILIIGCDPPKASILQDKETENGWNVKLLFKHDGCKVYRFYDNGYRYFVVRDSVEAEFINETPASDSDDPPVIDNIPTLK